MGSEPTSLDDIPECGESFCETCGDCVHCEGGGPAWYLGDGGKKELAWRCDNCGGRSFKE